MLLMFYCCVDPCGFEWMSGVSKDGANVLGIGGLFQKAPSDGVPEESDAGEAKG